MVMHLVLEAVQGAAWVVALQECVADLALVGLAVEWGVALQV